MTEQSETRRFHLGDVLSVTTGILVSPRRVAGVHELLDYLTGDTLMTHQLPRALEESRPDLLSQHPQLAGVTVPDDLDTEERVLVWLAGQVDRYGEELPVRPIPSTEHTRINPLDELAMNYPHLSVVPVVVSDHKISDGGGGERNV